ncbi:MAG: serine/threonine-protein phosphatase [Anaerolineaceae bacterium]|nr:serine/threonine-protein phosphatase [Anaerolineaceae bacterium]
MSKEKFSHVYTYAGLCDIGSLRQTNQDRIILHPEQDFFAVSDGMGGLLYGEDSAIYVSETMPKLVDISARNCSKNTSAEDAAEMLASSARMLSDALYQKGNSPKRFDYGATLAGVWLFADEAIYIGLGDSRGYLQRDGELKQVSEDMNIAGLMVRSGLMTREEAAESPANSRLTAFVGMEAPAEPITWRVRVQPGDVILLCSDGLYGMVPEPEITEVLKSDGSLDGICQKLIGSANAHGGRDNISAVVIRINK